MSSFFARNRWVYNLGKADFRSNKGMRSTRNLMFEELLAYHMGWNAARGGYGS